MKTLEENIHHQPPAQNLSRRAMLAKLAAVAGTATLGAVALDAGGALPAMASGMTSAVSPGVAITRSGSGGEIFRRLYYFATSTDGRIFVKEEASGSSWTELDGGGGTPAAPTATGVGFNNNYVFVAVRGYDENVYLNQGSPGHHFVGWGNMGAMSTDVAPSLTSDNNLVLLFAKDLSGRIFFTSWNLGGGAGPWREIGGDGRTDATPVGSIVNPSGSTNPYLFVAVKGLDGYIYLNQGGIGGPYVGWQTDWAMTTDVAPAMASQNNFTYLFAKGLDGYIYYNWWYLGGGGMGWARMGDDATRTDVAPAAVGVGDDETTVVVIKGLDGQFYRGWTDRFHGASTTWIPVS